MQEGGNTGVLDAQQATALIPPDAVLIAEADGSISLFSQSAEEMFHCPAAQALGQPVRRFIPDLSPKEAGRSTRRGVRFDGEMFPLEVSVSVAVIEGKTLTTIVARDITAQTQVDHAMKRSAPLFGEVWARSRDAMRLTDSEGTIRLVNQAYCELVSKPREQLEGQSLFSLYAPQDREQVRTRYRQMFATRRAESLLSREITLWDGRKLHLEMSSSFLELPGEPPLLLGVIRNIGARVSLEAQLRQAQKMEAVGRLAGGIAHDFNNLLTVINGYGELLLGQLPSDDPIQRCVAEMTRAGNKAATLTRQLLAFGRKQLLTPQVLDLNAVVEDLGSLFGRLIGEDITLTVSTAPNLWPVKVDPGGFEQVLMNLVVNARDAMPHGGQLTVETRNVVLDEHYAKSHPEAQTGAHVLLAVSDTGGGISPEILSHIFEPFFTTKGDKGTGLGLATVYGVVKQSGGHIGVYSELGRGTTFKVYFPRTAEHISSGKSHHDISFLPHGEETLLLVEDDAAIRALAMHVLVSCGYTVLTAENGEDALQVAGRHTGTIDLLVTDVVMPHLGGRQLAERLATSRPRMKVLYLSGYTDDAVVRHGVLQEGMAFIQKPFTTALLAQKVREVLSKGTVRPSSMMTTQG